MARSEAGPGSPHEEPDQQSSALRDPVQLRAALFGEFHAAMQAARAASLSVAEDPAAAVHRARKALRRARALLWMMSTALPQSERRAIKAKLQQARRSLSETRDHAVAAESLRTLPLCDADRDTAQRVLDHAAQVIPAIAATKKLLRKAATLAVAQAEVLQAALPAELSWREVSDGLARLYRQVRRALRAGRLSMQGFHSWRRRSRELAYALAFVAQNAGPRAVAIHREFRNLAGALGAPVDLIMLREFVQTHGEGLSPASLEHLRGTIDSQTGDLIEIALDAGDHAFDFKAKKFARRLTQAVERDLSIRPPVPRAVLSPC